MARWRPPIASIAAAVLLVQTLGPTAAHGVAHGGFGTDSGGPTDDDGGGGEDKPVVTNVDKPGELVDSQAFRPMFSMKCSRSKRQVKGSRKSCPDQNLDCLHFTSYQLRRRFAFFENNLFSLH